ncbi:DBIRD complex subunit ZNF326 [Xiphophorus maculatus]|uniref:DBIRD complex subunit ZNF326 n=1 Tax=Xiphophorus maculatus TaxID=8083 RepID=A0A3B5QCG6_XIPMA|nr:DBIRD complex subunit ZNF326 [Xiphophorus maculatus]
MRRMHRNPFEPVVRFPPPALGFKPAPAPRVPQNFIEAMKRISATPDTASKTQPQKLEADPSVDKWKSSFQPINKQKEESEDKSPSSEMRTELYDPNNPLSSDSEPEMSQLPPAVQNSSQRCKRPSPDRDASRWESSTAANRPLERRPVPQTARPTDSRDLSPGHVLANSRAYSPDSKLLDRPGYEFPTGHLEARIHSPDRLSHGSSSQAIPESFRGPRTNGGERKPLPDYPREMAAPPRVSPPRLKRDRQQLGYVERGLDQEAPPPKLTRIKGENAKLNKCPITCDLCDIELSNAQELEEHLDSRTHWDTLEHIQRSSSYDDMAIAFLQEVMVYKSQHCSRAVEEDALPGLQENHHMTKVEMLHCAACKVHVSTSAAEVQAHVSSLEHLTNTKGFEVQQRHSCLSKAEAMLKKLQPQFELFLKGACPFE